MQFMRKWVKFVAIYSITSAFCTLQLFNRHDTISYLLASEEIHYLNSPSLEGDSLRVA